MPASTKEIRNIFKVLRAEYGKKSQGRLKDPLDSLIETILSQNTSDKNSLPAFYALRSRFRTWESARTAPISAIEKIIKPAGLFRIKARRVINVLNMIKSGSGSTSLGFLKKLPAQRATDYLAGLKGVGPKTLACVMLFSLGKPYFPVDTHILRVTKRLGLIGGKTSAAGAHDIFDKVVPPALMYELHLNLIEHGRRTCHARNPKCHICRLRAKCNYFRSNKKRPT